MGGLSAVILGAALAQSVWGAALALNAEGAAFASNVKGATLTIAREGAAFIQSQTAQTRRSPGEAEFCRQPAEGAILAFVRMSPRRALPERSRCHRVV